MDAEAVVTLLGGLGMFLLGIHHLTEGLKDLAGDSLRRDRQEIEHRQTERYPLQALQEQAWQILNDYTAGTRILKVQAVDWPELARQSKDIAATLTQFRRQLQSTLRSGQGRSDADVLNEARESTEEALRVLRQHQDRLRDLRESAAGDLATHFES